MNHFPQFLVSRAASPKRGSWHASSFLRLPANIFISLDPSIPTRPVRTNSPSQARIPLPKTQIDRSPTQTARAATRDPKSPKLVHIEVDPGFCHIISCMRGGRLSLTSWRPKKIPGLFLVRGRGAARVAFWG
jgi:hypothetical protein